MTEPRGIGFVNTRRGQQRYLAELKDAEADVDRFFAQESGGKMTEFEDMRNLIEELDYDARWLMSSHEDDRQLDLDVIREMDFNAKRLVELIGEAIKVRYK